MSRSTASRAEPGSVLTALQATLGRAWRAATRTARLAIGIPDYDVYLAHLRMRHPEQVPMGRDAFFHERMQARYGKGRSRCC
jgi:uncharacterized short protein YbdD (DUF466 family)